ncbi:conjugal transfer protein MobA [Sphingobacterium sp.]|uniref:conjugal transfer protein MobA n=1 Tax=Sphingobacterium sp. TaxID=341027 RepID=UPI00289ADD68|nr:conjugal transfer protein MobA [Sphingobacterium sp.]
MKDNNKKVLKKSGRKPKADPAKIRYTISFNQVEHAQFLALFDKSGMKIKAHFITSCIFEKTIKTVHIDKGTLDCYMRLTSFHSQFRAVGVNYNQVVKLLYSHFSERKAAAYLYKLEKQTLEMVIIFKKVVQLIEEFETKYLKKQNDGSMHG